MGDSIIFRKFLSSLVILQALFCMAKSADTNPKVLVIHSYGSNYTWTDSVSKGIKSVFEPEQISVFTEFLDAKNFGQIFFDESYRLIRRKYKNVPIRAILVCDNDALEFSLLHMRKLFPAIPVFFCGVVNVKDYIIPDSIYFGVTETFNKDSYVDFIVRILPRVQNLYLFADSTTSSLSNINTFRRVENKFPDLQFHYIMNPGVDSILAIIPLLKPGSAIALMDVFQDKDGAPVNSNHELSNQVAGLSAAPVFLNSDPAVGGNLAGGLNNKGSYYGREIASMALRYLKTGNLPDKQIIEPVQEYFVNYPALKKFGIELEKIPRGTLVFNKPRTDFLRYIVIILALSGFLLLQMLVIVLLFRNIRKRKRAEVLVEKQISELDQAKARAEESDKLKTAFLANMSHEIRTPLNAIVGFSSLLTDPQTSPENIKKYYGIINLSVERLLRLIDDILDLARIESDQIIIRNENINAWTVVTDLVETFRNRSISDQVEIRCMSPSISKTVIVYTDKVRLQQILSNFMSNAVKFTESGYIEAGYQITSPSQIEFYVKDTGLGISEDDQIHVFDRFWKKDKGNESFSQGVGLGLSISARLAEVLGGNLRFESKAGNGSTFYFSLPCCDNFEGGLVQNKTGHQTGQADLAGYRVAVAEDEEFNLNFISEVLEGIGIQVEKFANGQELVNCVANTPGSFHLVLLDIKMPVMDGHEAHRQIRKINPRLPVIAHTAYAMEDDLEKIRQEGFADILVKPAGKQELIRSITQILMREP